MPNEREFKYDVAFSLLGRDAEVAQALASQLAPLRCFVFTQRQRDLVGRNGIEAFAEIFRREARLAVVLYRAGYGETEYTDLEARGIQDRGMETSWQSPVLINLDGSPPPPWFPKRNIWLDLQRYPIDEAVGAIRLLAEELGAQRRNETATEFLKRAATRKTDEEARRRHEDTAAAVREVDVEVKTLFADLDACIRDSSAELAQFDPFVIPTQLGIAIATRGGSLVVDWHSKYCDSLTESALYVKLYDGYISVGDRRAARTSELLSYTGYKSSLDVSHVWRWVPDDSSHPLTTAELAQHVLKQLFTRLFEE